MKTTYELNLPETFDVERGKDDTFARVRVDVAALSPEIIGKLVLHGLKQKVADAAAGAKKVSEADDETRTIAQIAEDLMTKVVTNLEKGDWGAERDGGSGVSLGYGSAVDAAIISIMRGHVKRAEPKAYAAAKEPERKAMCATVFAEQSAETQKGIVEMAERAVEKAREEAEAAAGLEIKIAL